MGGVINTITTNTITYLLASTAFAVCHSGASVVEKIATIYDPQNTSQSTNFSLMNGVTVQVLFDQSNTATNPTLNINGTGNIPIYANASSTGVIGIDIMHSWPAHTIVSLTYTGIEINEETVYIWLLNNANTQTSLTNSAGSMPSTNTKLFLVGAPSQDSTNTGVITYSNEGNYIGTDNKLYSNFNQVITTSTPGYANLETAAYLNANEVAVNNEVIDLDDADNDTLPTSEMVANTIKANINNVTQTAIGIDETADDPEQQPDFEGYQHSILIAKDHSTSSTIDSTYKPIDLVYNPNQRELTLSNASINPNILQSAKLTNNALSFENDQLSSSLGFGSLILSEDDGTDITTTIITSGSSSFAGNVNIGGDSYIAGDLAVTTEARLNSLVVSNTSQLTGNVTLNGILTSSNKITLNTSGQATEDMITLQSTTPRYQNKIGNRYIFLRDSGTDNTAPSSANILGTSILGPTMLYIVNGINANLANADTQMRLSKDNLQFINPNGTYTLTTDKIQFLSTLQTPIKTNDDTNWGIKNINIIPNSLEAFNLVYVGNFVQINIRFTTINDVSLETPGTYLLFTVNNGFKCMSTFYGNIYRYSPPYVDSQVCVFFNANNGNIYANNLAPDTTYNINFTYIATD